MAVRWNWKEKMGEVQYKDPIEPKKHKIDIYDGNCLMVMIHNYKQENQKMYQFMGFMSDINHLKRCIGLEKNYDGKKDNIYLGIWGKFKLNTYYKKTLTIAENLTKAGYKVELYYKEIKRSKTK